MHSLYFMIPLSFQFSIISTFYKEESQCEGPAAGMTRIILDAPGVLKGNPAVTTNRSLGSCTKPLRLAISQAARNISRKLSGSKLIVPSS
mmetsp:Transcript_55200/g.62493  ORF Transcript_55200/g.62493 Transcript_55200/m.62493 type:complete len:90 (+) Transcript_55200:469-738(+)